MLTKVGLLLLLVISVVGTQRQSSPAKAPRISSSEIPTVSLCTLLSKPADYHGKQVRVRARYHIGFESSIFVDHSCKNNAVATTPFWYGHVIWVDFDKSVEAATKPEIYSDFKRSASLCCPDGWRDTEVGLLVVGKFSKSNYQGPANDKGYGHSGRYALQLIVSRIEEVGASERK